ncbi:uncharacterized protein LOC142317432 [Lycorma delicatula]|uniref:uncharacterized protein LOC142317432 n=1 Tax=Lycorma delicatula TaxID=130591 RepID=UPI003F5181F4
MGSGGGVPNRIMYKELEPITDMHKRLGFFRHNHEDAVFKTSETANAIMDVPVKNIYVYEAFPSNSIKLETEDDTTKETLLLILPHHPIEDDITPVCESESLQVKEEPINNGCDNIDEVTDPLVSEGTNLIKLEDHKIKNEAELRSY